jgi:1,4-dihydroxy-2-naphthoate octaprenyltransferase
MTFEWLPMINPYIWPFSVFQVLTGPYFSFWSRVLPSIKLDKSSVEISGIVALEVLNSLIYFCVRFTNLLLVILEESEKNTLLGS